MGTWYTRAVLFVADVDESVRFYTEMLGFEKSWQHDHEGQPIIVQVNRQGSDIILTLSPERAGGSRLFISLEPEDMQAQNSDRSEVGARDGNLVGLSLYRCARSGWERAAVPLR